MGIPAGHRGRTLIDARVLSARWAAFTRDTQAAVPSKLGGGVALAAALRHRRSRDLDLFLPSADAVSILRRALPEIAARAGVTAQIVQEAPGFVRARLVHPEEGELGLDLVHDAAPELAPDPVVIDGIALVSDRDLRASKLTCLLSRSEPRDLVDVLFLERAVAEHDDPQKCEQPARSHGRALASRLRRRRREWPCSSWRRQRAWMRVARRHGACSSCPRS